MIGKRQILFSCGDDGYVSIFDVNAIKAIGETDIDHWNTRGVISTTQKSSVFLFSLDSGEFAVNGKQK